VRQQYADRSWSVLFVTLSITILAVFASTASADIVFSSEIIVSTLADGASSVCLADFDGDGDLDLASSSMYDDKIAWYRNLDGSGTFSTELVITTTAMEAMSVCAADLDGDGDQDILAASRANNMVAWYENANGLGSFGAAQVLANDENGIARVLAADLDHDGDLDVLTAAYNDDRVAWYMNMDGQGTFSPRIVITTATNEPTFIATADIDGDGDLDLLSSSSLDGKIAWYANQNGSGIFGGQQIIAYQSLARCVAAADIDGDGDLDVLSTANGTDRVAWYENTDGAGTFGEINTISIGMNDPQCLTVADLDWDGDNDVVAISFHDDKVFGYENIDGNGTFDSQQMSVTADGGIFVTSGDLDGDGDTDVVSASRYDDTIAWYRNDAPPPPAWLGLTPVMDVIPANGGPLAYNAHFTYNLPSSRAVDYWAMVQLAGGQVLGPVMHQPFLATTGMNVTQQIVHQVPAGLPAGIHTYGGMVGDYPNAQLTDSFTFTKLASTVDSSPDLGAWSTLGGFAASDSGPAIEGPDPLVSVQAYPNPFNASTTFQIALPVAAELTVSVTNVLGQRVALLSQGRVDAGQHSFTFDANDLPGGIYFVRVYVPGEMDEVQKVVLMK
jgi:VCBS repeat protein/type IX secretion system substrate protein